MFENILVAVDRSKHSDAAFDVAMDIGQQIFDSMKQRARKDIIVFEMSKCFCRRAMQQRGLWKLQVR
jgi:hypothetical protein